MIIEVGNGKGGVGKSTTAVNLAAYLSRQYSVILVDTDTQLSSAKWDAMRTHCGLEKQFTVVEKIVAPAEQIVMLSREYDVVVVDVGGSDYANLGTLSRMVDLWIAPTGVSQKDLEATVSLAHAFQGANKNHKNGKIPLVVNVNIAPGAWNSTEGVDAVEALKKALPEVEVLDTVVRDRKVWRDAEKLGKTIFEMPAREREKAEAEFVGMVKEAMAAYKKFQKVSK